MIPCGDGLRAVVARSDRQLACRLRPTDQASCLFHETRKAGGGVSKKKNKTELMPPDPAGELPAVVADPPEVPAEAPTPEPPAPAEDLAPTAAEPEAAEPTPAFLTEPAQPIAPAPAETVPAAPPVALVAPEASITPLIDRITKLEEAFAALQKLQGLEQRVTERITQLQLAAHPEAAPRRPVVTAATAILDAGKTLMPVLTVPTAQPIVSPAPNASTAAQRMWLVWDTLAEARAILRMYVDPRYSLSWMGRTVPLILLAAFLTTQIWVPFSSVTWLGWIPIKAADLLIGFLLFKVLGHEARRYRETAPDLPPNLRL
jgi:hypothetical protein